ncbi:MAG: RNA polymerase-associated protein RapA [Verrucomicrobiota bacterium]|nr:RNA polymerase-associated protein RapA [Verrucomicrobiota bacterium]
MQNFVIGQRWTSETEPELGLGIVVSTSRHHVSVLFPASNETRLYATNNAPIKRVEFRPGDSIQSQTGQTVLIESIKLEKGVITYICDGVEVPEAELADTTSFSKPEERLISGQYDRSSTFELRYETMAQQAKAKQSAVSGFIGGRIDLIPHQLYIASEVSNRYMPRVLLADEVGLGKTIEACLILHRLHLTGRAERILILLPESLVHQWFIELLRRFNLWFTLVDEPYCESVTAVDKEANPFNEKQLVICSVKTLLEHSRWKTCALDSNWDMLVVDEAHHLKWAPQVVSPEYKLVERLTQKSHGLLLLTATPEQLGAEGHFARLRLLDPARYPDLDKFCEEQSGYVKVAQVANKLIEGVKLSPSDLQYLRGIFEDYNDESFSDQLKVPSNFLEALIDRHGTGRVIFRNSRDNLKGFPMRRCLPKQLEPRDKLSRTDMEARLLREFIIDKQDPNEQTETHDFRNGPRILWLAEFLKGLGKDEKVLLICSTLGKIQGIYKALLEEVNLKVALFHEELSLLQRDRNAAWFAEPAGAKILLCSEIGSEGRNFQFAHHLVLFDLPLNPELLEQRIGRLDRIGQNETIKIHIPFLANSWIELLMRWHHQGLNGVEHSLKGGYAYFDKFYTRIRALCLRYHLADNTTVAEADQLIEESMVFRSELEDRLSKGQDRLIALNSNGGEAATKLVDNIHTIDADPSLELFMNRIFDHFGVKVEDIDNCTFRLEPDQLFTDSFPCLHDGGVTVTYDRTRALSREDIDFLTWDHPMVRGAMDLMLSFKRGNSTIVVWKDLDFEAPAILIEAIYMLESVAPSRLHVDRFLPPSPLRVLVDIEGKDFSNQLSHEFINRHCSDEEAFRLKKEPALLQALLPEMLRSAKEYARAQKSTYLKAAMTKAHKHLDHEAKRLKELQKVNPNVRDEEIEIAESVINDVTRHIAKAHIRLDAVRLIISQV